jgi:hypothetical protein
MQQGPAIHHSKLRKQFESARENVRQSTSHVHNFLHTIARGERDMNTDPQTLLELRNLKEVVTRQMHDNVKIEVFMNKELLGFSEYQTMILRGGNRDEIMRVREKLSRKQIKRLTALGLMLGPNGEKPTDQRIEDMGKSDTIKREDWFTDKKEGDREVAMLDLDCHGLLNKLNEAQQIIGSDPEAPPPKQYDEYL